jgi:hypothetical protein
MLDLSGFELLCSTLIDEFITKAVSEPVEEKKRWAQERLVYYEREGLVLEAEKMRQLLRACDLELHEMAMIVAYRKDETRVIQIQSRPKRPS